MKIKNKRTGEIATLTLSTNGEDMIIMGNDMYAHIAKLSELKDYEDYKEPKEYWYIENNGDIDREIYDGDNYEEKMIEIGNYFNTREEAELAVRKLKAWKRLKDKGFGFEYYDYSDRDLHNHIQIKAITNREVEDSMLCKEDLDLLFGGEK